MLKLLLDISVISKSPSAYTVKPQNLQLGHYFIFIKLKLKLLFDSNSDFQFIYVRQNILAVVYRNAIIVYSGAHR